MDGSQADLSHRVGRARDPDVDLSAVVSTIVSICVGRPGIEPGTRGLKVRCSAD